LGLNPAAYDAEVPELVFVMSAQANLFWAEIAQAVCDELEAIGVRARVTTEGFPPPERGLVYVVAPPHEYFALEVARPANPPPPKEVLRRTIFICGEQPGTSHFDENVVLAPQGGAVFDLNRGAIREFTRRGVRAMLFQLGYTPRWDHRGAEGNERDIDLLFMGSHSQRRDRYLADFAETLWRWHCRLVLSDNSGPNFAPSARYLADEGKWDALTRSKVLLNIHQGTVPYFEWARVVQTMANGCSLVTEHSTDFAPLEPGEHFVCAGLHNAALVAEALIEDNDARETLTTNAYEFLRRELPMRRAAEELASVAADVDQQPVVESASGMVRSWRRAAAFSPGVPPSSNDGVASVRHAVSDVLSELRDVEQAIERWGGSTDRMGPCEIAATSSSYGVRTPRVWVLTVIRRTGTRVERTLDSVVLGRYRDLGFVLVDDGTTDRAYERVQRWMRRHRSIPVVVLRHSFRRGVSRSVNGGLALADAEFTLILPAGSSLFPHALDRLVARLDWEEDADFAYGLIQRRDPDSGVGLDSIYPWEPARLRAGPYIDEIALVRTPVLRSAGGYTTDNRLDGWQAHDLWCGLAERGRHGAFVPEILARGASTQRASPADLDPATAYEALTERHPNLMAGVTATA
jgi:Glycosyl transferase family 2